MIAINNRQALNGAQLISRLSQLNGWHLHGEEENLAIEKKYAFASYLHALAFTNAVAYFSEQTDHHPDIILNYRHCTVRWRTHDAQGITLLDFECAQHVDSLFDPHAEPIA